MPKQKNTSATAAAHQCGNREFACGFLANAAAASVAGLLLLAAPSLVRAGRVSQAENSMYGQRAWTNNTAIRPFRIDILEAALTELRKRIVATRWPDRETAADQSQGAQMAKMQELIRYWGREYDWRKVEAKLNALPQFVMEIDGLDIHFIHVRSRHGNALPLLLTHGWPGSILEFVKVIGPLTDPTAFGGRAEDAFDVVIPSIPGYGFSAKPKETGWGPDRIGRAWDVLMKRLGYTRYVSQGGDHGSVISTVMARQAPAGLLGIHLTMPATVPENAARALSCGDQPPLGLSAGEKAAFESLQTFFTKNAGDGVMMVTRPQTVSYGLSDSPVGLAAWIYDKFAQWTYSGGEPERSLTKDEMLDDITLYWLTNSAISAARFYWENNNNNFSSAAQKTTEIAIPIAVTVFPGEIYRAPKSWTQRAFRNLTYFNQVDKGGHFAAWEDRSFSLLKSDRPFEECDKHTHSPTGDDHEENRNRVVAPPSFRNGWCVCRRWAARTVAATC